MLNLLPAVYRVLSFLTLNKFSMIVDNIKNYNSQTRCRFYFSSDNTGRSELAIALEVCAEAIANE